MFRVTTYARSPEMKSERNTQQILANITGSRHSKNYISVVTFNYFFSDSLKVSRIKASLLMCMSMGRQAPIDRQSLAKSLAYNPIRDA